MSQRDLAGRVGVPVSTLARIESGSADDPKFRTVERLIAAAGAVLTVGSPPPANPAEHLTDRRGRHYPAHLDVHKERVPWRSNGSGPSPEPSWSFFRDRVRRDSLRAHRARQAEADQVEIVQMPANPWHWVGRGPDGAVAAQLLACVLDGTAHVLTLEIADGWRLLGLGRRLVNALRDEMARSGICRARLIAEDLSGVEFCYACGFERDRARPVRFTWTLL